MADVEKQGFGFGNLFGIDSSLLFFFLLLVILFGGPFLGNFFGCGGFGGDDNLLFFFLLLVILFCTCGGFFGGF